jgi:hypothetical protein
MASPAAEAAIKKLARVSGNTTCPNCGTHKKFGFSTVCMKSLTFVCNACKSSHQAFSHRCKSLTMSSWTEGEVLQLKVAGNDKARDTWLALAPPIGTGGRPKEGDPIEVFKAFINAVYDQKQYYSDEGPPNKNAHRHVEMPVNGFFPPKQDAYQSPPRYVSPPIPAAVAPPLAAPPPPPPPVPAAPPATVDFFNFGNDAPANAGTTAPVSTDLFSSTTTPSASVWNATPASNATNSNPWAQDPFAPPATTASATSMLPSSAAPAPADPWAQDPFALPATTASLPAAPAPADSIFVSTAPAPLSFDPFASSASTAVAAAPSVLTTTTAPPPPPARPIMNAPTVGPNSVMNGFGSFSNTTVNSYNANRAVSQVPVNPFADLGAIMPNASTVPTNGTTTQPIHNTNVVSMNPFASGTMHANAANNSNNSTGNNGMKVMNTMNPTTGAQANPNMMMMMMNGNNAQANPNMMMMMNGNNAQANPNMTMMTAMMMNNNNNNNNNNMMYGMNPANNTNMMNPAATMNYGMNHTNASLHPGGVMNPAMNTRQMSGTGMTPLNPGMNMGGVPQPATGENPRPMNSSHFTTNTISTAFGAGNAIQQPPTKSDPFASLF